MPNIVVVIKSLHVTVHILFTRHSWGNLQCSCDSVNMHGYTASKSKTNVSVPPNNIIKELVVFTI